MTPWLAALLGLVLGGAVGAAVVWTVVASRRAKEQRLRDETAPAVSSQVLAAMEVLRSAAIVVGPHDEVIAASSLAKTLGLAKETRIAVPPLLNLVREARRMSTHITREIDVPRGIGIEAMPVQARIANLGGGALLVLADDLSTERRFDASRRDFVANVSHELKTPIGAISVLSEAIETAADDPDQVVRFASRLQSESTRLAELVGQIINLSRLQADDPLQVSEEVDLADIAAEAIARNKTVSESRRVKIVTQLAGGCVVAGDAVQLTNAVANLIVNAISYSDPGARVAVTVRRADDEVVEVSVADNGIGIKPEDQERVFERFFRVDYGRSRASGGTGLGLSIVRHIAAAHGGTVALWSRPGQGSTFTIRLPALAVEQPIEEGNR